jgi:hypothetical protein
MRLAMTNTDINSLGTLDLTGCVTDLPPGDYNGTIIKSEVSSRSDNLWWALEVLLNDTGYVPPAQIVAIGARGDSPNKRRMAEGLRALNQVARATGINLGKDLNPKKIQKLFLKKPVLVRYATARRDGVLELVIRKFLPKIQEQADE